jgi:hypothetical protein
MKWKAVTPNFTVSEDWRITIEKIGDGNQCFVKVTIGDQIKERLFASEEAADDFVSYLTESRL